jgi:hypothetical protein
LPDEPAGARRRDGRHGDIDGARREAIVGRIAHCVRLPACTVNSNRPMIERARAVNIIEDAWDARVIHVAWGRICGQPVAGGSIRDGNNKLTLYLIEHFMHLPCIGRVSKKSKGRVLREFVLFVVVFCLLVGVLGAWFVFLGWGFSRLTSFF